MNLIESASEYLAADGYAVTRRGRSLVVGNRATLGENTEFVYVWVVDDAALRSFSSQEEPFLRSFAEVAVTLPRSNRFLLVPSMEGLSREFRKRAQEQDVRQLVPVQFFDTEFSWERSPETASGMRDLVSHAEGRRRVQQPYESSQSRSGDDALAPLIEGLNSGRRPVQIVIGPAGAGKSVLFEALFARLYADFQTAKRELRTGSRPLPLTPASVAASRERSVSGLLNTFLDTNFARPLSRDVFDWMMSHRLATWLIDGLDEVIAADPTFFDDLADLITRGGELPSIALFVRDALTATNDSFRQFLEEYGSGCSVYQLAPWRDEQKRQFAQFALPGASTEFMAAIRARPALDSLASSPFYCTVLADLYGRDELKADITEETLLSRAVSSILDREYEKHLFEPQVMPKVDIEGYVQVIAAQDLEEGLQGVPAGTAAEWAALAVPEDAPPGERETIAQRLTQTAFFTASGGKVRFAQEVLEHYLLGRYLLSLVERHPDLMAAKLNTYRIPPDWLTLRIVASGMREHGTEDHLKAVLQSALGKVPAFANAVQLAAFVPLNLAADASLSFENEALTGVQFTGLDLRGISFRNTDLTDASFVDCSLDGAVLEDAILRNTGFIGSTSSSLANVQTGELRRFFSIRVEKDRRIETHADASKWFGRRVGRQVVSVEPCDGALQLRFLFMKFVHPDGSARRSWLDRNGVTRGKRYSDPAAALAAALRYGYLTEDQRGLISRPGGDKYSEMVQYVMALRLSPSLQEVLADICPRSGCTHVPEQSVVTS